VESLTEDFFFMEGLSFKPDCSDMEGLFLKADSPDIEVLSFRLDELPIVGLSLKDDGREREVLSFKADPANTAGQVRAIINTDNIISFLYDIFLYSPYTQACLQSLCLDVDIFWPV